MLCLIAALFLPSNAEAQHSKVARTTLYGTVISSDLWEEGGEYGVYAIPVQKNTSLSKVYGDSLFHTEGTAVYHNGRYYIPHRRRMSHYLMTTVSCSCLGQLLLPDSIIAP